MRKMQVYAAIAVYLLITLFLPTCTKKDKAKQGLDEVTVSSKLINNLSEANKWFEFTFEAHVAAGISEQQMAPMKVHVQDYYVSYLHSVEKGANHEIYFRWIKLSDRPLTYKLQAYITPAPERLEGVSDRVTSGGNTTPPAPPPPPPPCLC